MNFTVKIAMQANGGVATQALTQGETVPAGKVGFYYNGARLGDFADYDADAGTATMVYDTTKKVIPAGSLQQVKVKFGGTDTLAPSEADFFVQINKANQTLAFAQAKVSQHVGTISNKLSGAATAVTYASNNSAVATVAADGTAAIAAPGTATISAIAAGDDWYNAGTATYELTATPHEFKTFIYDANDPAKGHWQRCELDGCTATTAISEHNFGKWAVKKGATTTENGERARACDDCGYTEKQEIPAAKAPVFEQPAVSVHVSCTDPVASPALQNVETTDKVTYSIGDAKVAAIDAATGKVSVVAPGETKVTATVQRDGYKAMTATYEFAVTDHEFDEGAVTTAATCTEPGVKTLKCKFKGCDETKTEVIPALGHAWAEDFTIDTPATCTTDGSKSKHCMRIGSDGKLCNAINPDSVEAIHAAGHQLAYQFNAEGHWQQCANCDYTTEPEAHQFGEWTVTKQATATEAGERSHACVACGYTVTEEIAATGDNKGDQGDTGNKGDQGDTGDKGDTDNKGDSGDQGGNSGTTGADTGKPDNGNGSAAGDKPNTGSSQGNGSNVVNSGNAMAATADGMAGVAGAAVAMGAIALAGAAFAARRRHNG